MAGFVEASLTRLDAKSARSSHQQEYVDSLMLFFRRTLDGFRTNLDFHVGSDDLLLAELRLLSCRAPSMRKLHF